MSFFFFQNQRHPDQSDSERSLGSHDREHRRLKVKEKHTSENKGEEEDAESKDDDRLNTSKEYEHIKDAKSHSDAQTIDVATKEQMQEKQAVPTQMNEDGDGVDEDDDVRMEDEEEDMVRAAKSNCVDDYGFMDLFEIFILEKWVYFLLYRLLS